MKTIVITGSSRGIGLGMAKECLHRGHQVVVSGSAETSTDKAIAELAQAFPAERMLGHPCNVTRYGEVQQLWRAAQQAFGRIDIWINNAGVSNNMAPVWRVDDAEIDAVVDIDLKGVLYGCKVAIAGMTEQGGGHIYNMEGFGSGDEMQSGLTVYGCAKRAVRYLSEGLQKELQGTPVKVSTLSPGIVVTDMLLDQSKVMPKEDWERSKKVFNILGDTVETVTPWLVERLLENDKSGARLAWLTKGKAMLRFMAAGFQKRDLFAGI